MLKDIIIQLLPQVLTIVLTAIVGFIATIFRNWCNANKALIETEKQQLIQLIGVDNYNKEVNLAKTAIQSVEEQARNFNWDSTIKHAKATEAISNATGLTDEEIYNIIKATVNEWNMTKPNVQ